MKKYIKNCFYAFAFALIIAVAFGKPLPIQAASYKTVTVPSNGKKVSANGMTFYMKSYPCEDKENDEWYVIDELHVIKDSKDILVYKSNKDTFLGGDKIVTNGSKVYFTVGNFVKDSGHLYVYTYNQSAKLVEQYKQGRSSIEGYYNGRIFLTITSETHTNQYKFAAFTLKNSATTTISKYSFYRVAAKNSQYYWLRNNMTGKTIVYNAKTKKKKTIINSGMERVIVSGGKCYYITVHKDSMKNLGWADNDFGIWNFYMTKPVTIDIGRMYIKGTGKKTLVKNLTVRDVLSFTSKCIKYKNTKGKIVTKKY